jgi:hypothetical protein
MKSRCIAKLMCGNLQYGRDSDTYSDTRNIMLYRELTI